MQILFMGSAAFAVPTLQALAASTHRVLEVVAQPDKPAGRGRHLTPCPVAAAARELGLPLYQPASVRKPEPLEHFRTLSPELIVIVAYGKILPPELLSIPKRGAINVHASLLPRYRGAAPINWAIANGERESGVTTMFINEELDAGDLLLSAATPIGADEDAAALYERLAPMGAELLLTTLEKLGRGEITPVPQEHSKATFAPILRKEDGRIDWSLPAHAIFNRIRGFAPWPGAFTTFEGRLLRIHRALPSEEPQQHLPGTVIEGSRRLVVAAGAGSLELLEVQPEGGRRMPVVDFLRGHAIAEGTVLR